MSSGVAELAGTAGPAYGNILRNNTYPLSVSAERIFQAIAIAKQAKKLVVDYIAHGSTGAGNYQIRFDMIFNITNCLVLMLHVSIIPNVSLNLSCAFFTSESRSF